MQDQKGNIGVIVSFIIVVGLIGLVVYFLINKTEKIDPLDGISKVSEKIDNKENLTTSKEDINNLQKNNMNPNTRTLSNFTPVSKVSTLEKIDLKKGEGTEVKAGDTVVAHYTGAVAATGAVFQASKDFGPDPVPFSLNSVIKGWTEGIPGMKIGGTRRLVIPSDMAYGATPPPGSGIPANADLVFDVELVAIK